MAGANFKTHVDGAAQLLERVLSQYATFQMVPMVPLAIFSLKLEEIAG